MLQKHEFDKLCKLSRLHINEDEEEKFINKLNEIFDWIDQLQEIDTSNVTLSADATKEEHERNDIVLQNNTIEEVLSNTEYKKYNMFAVPKVVE